MEVINQSGLKPLLKSKRGGSNAGTYGHKSIALSYAKYLDPRLHVLVNQVFFERLEEEKNPDLIVDRAITTYKKKGMSEDWITKRLTGKGVRNEFTSLLSKHGVRWELSKAISFAETLAMDDIEKNRRYGNEECAITSNKDAKQVSNSIKEFRRNSHR